MKKIPVSEDDNEFSAEPQSGAASSISGSFDAEARASMLDSCILFCDAVIAGKDSAVALKYDEENMLAPMIVMLEKGASAASLVLAAEKLGVPVIHNVVLAKNLTSSGKVGDSISEASYRDVALALARLGFNKNRQPGNARKSRRGISVKKPRPLSLELGGLLFALTGEYPGREALLAEPLNAESKKLKKLLGFPVPPPRVFENPRLKNDEYRILFKGLEAGRGRIELGWYAEKFRDTGSGGQPSGDTLGRAPAGKNTPVSYEPLRVFPDMMNDPENISAAAKAASIVLVDHVKEIVERRAPELLGRDEVQAILDAAAEKYPVVTFEVKSLLSLAIIREILMGLVSERVSIRYIAVILETLADWGSFGPAPNELVIDQIRMSLKRQICLEYADDRLTLRVLTLDAKLEKTAMEHVSVSGFDADDSLPGEEWMDVIISAARGMKEKGFPPVILCSARARSPLKEATRRKIPDLAVLSYMEIPSDLNVEHLGEIRL